MSIRTFLKSLTSVPARPRPARLVPRLSVEPMEDRCLPSGYTIAELGSLIEGGSSQAYDINASGQVVGRAYAGMGTEHAFLWQNGVMTDLGTLGGAASQAFGINDAGQVVGTSNQASDWTAYRAFLVTPEDTNGDGTPDRWFRDANGDGANDLMRNLGTLGGTSPTSVARDVNNLGRVVGNASWSSSSGNQSRPFLWQGGVMTNLGTFGGSYGTAEAINDAGQVTGAASGPTGTMHAFLRAGGVMVDLGISSGGVDINSNGQLVDSDYGQARLWSPAVPNGPTGTFTNLDVLPPLWPESGWATAAPRGMNNTGQVVGTQADYYGEETTGVSYGGVLWAGGVPEALPVEYAEAINDAGQVVGNSGSRAYLLTPVPSGVPLVSVGDVSVIEGHAGTRTATFTVTLSVPGTETVTVAYATANGSATAGSDFQSTSGTLTFAPGQTTKTITVLVNGDRLGETNELFTVNLSSPTNATIGDGYGLGAIVDDEPRISVSDVSKAEGKKGQTTLFTFTVTLPAAYDQAVTMSFRTADGAAKTSDKDYVTKTGTLTFAPGETTRTITIEVKGDSKREENEYFFLDLFGLSSNSLFTKARGLGTILNDD